MVRVDDVRASGFVCTMYQFPDYGSSAILLIHSRKQRVK